VQAQSRLHAQGITLRMREQVAMEGMQVVHRHLGAAPAHWLVTHVSEALAACPFDAETATVQRHLLSLADQAAPWLGPGGAGEAQRQMQACDAWKLLRPELVTSVYADGWAGPALELRLQQPAAQASAVAILRLHGRHAWPRPGRLRLKLTVWHEGRPLASRSVWWRQRFVLEVPVARRMPGSALRFEVRASHAFVPANAVPGSSDRRSLAYRVEGLECLSAEHGPLD